MKKLLSIFVLTATALPVALPAAVAPTNAAPEILAVNADGSFSNTNVIGNVAAFAAAEAASEVAQDVSKAAYTAATNAQQIVRDGIAEIQAGAKIEYSDLFVWAAGAMTLSTNAACNIYRFVPHQNITTNIDSVAHFAADIKYTFTEDIGSYVPEIRYQRNLNATNEWVNCQQDDPIGPYTDETETPAVQNAYLSRTWIPAAYAHSFFKVFVDSAAPGTGATVSFVNGVTGGFTGEIVIPPTGKYLHIKVVGGVVTNITAGDAQ